MNADQIVVVMNGEIVETGSHLQLLEKKGKYSELWSNASADIVGENATSVP